MACQVFFFSEAFQIHLCEKQAKKRGIGTTREQIMTESLLLDEPHLFKFTSIYGV